MKTCTKCNKCKALTEFSKRSNRPCGLASQCKVCMNAATKKWQQKNREKYNAGQRKWRQNNREKHNASSLKRSKRPEYKKRANARNKERYRTDPQYRLAKNLRSRVHNVLKGNVKSAPTMTMLGCSFMHLQDYLEKQFLPGMTWENHGPVWHVDHMMPCASFDLTDPEQQRQCCHYTNLQPMWGSENISKSDKVIYNRTWNGFRWE